MDCFIMRPPFTLFLFLASARSYDHPQALWAPMLSTPWAYKRYKYPSRSDGLPSPPPSFCTCACIQVRQCRGPP